MDATVILLHRLPDGSEHFDWLLQRPMAGPLIAFRLASRPDLAAHWRAAAERLPDHREIYLTYEGDLTQNRGSVKRLARGQCLVEREDPSFLRASIRFGDITTELEARASSNSLWELILRPTGPARGR